VHFKFLGKQRCWTTKQLTCMNLGGILPYLVVTDGLGREIILVTVLVNGKDFAVIHLFHLGVERH
jgi:hypothetical protein